MKVTLARLVVGALVVLLTLLVADRALGAFKGGVAKPVNALGMENAVNEQGTQLLPNFSGRYVNAEYSIDIAINSSGLRGPEVAPKRAGVARILALGDSFTFGQGVEYGQAWPALIGSMSPRLSEVVNAGWAAPSPVGQLAYLEGPGMRLEPDLVLDALFVGNDVVDDLAVSRGLARGANVVEFQATYLTNLQARVGVQGALRDLIDTALPNLYEAATLAFVRGQYAMGARRGLFDYILADEPPAEIREGWALTLAAVSRMASEVEARGKRFGLIIVPFYDQVARSDFGQGYTADLPQKRILARCSERGIACLDLRPVLMRAGDASALYYLKDGHLTVDGQRVAADAIAAWLTREGLW